MAVFYDTGGGDFYGGPTKEAVLAAIREDIGDEDFNEIEDEINEVPGTMKVIVLDEEEKEAIFFGVGHEDAERECTLDGQYDEAFGAYCVASSNC